MNWTTAADLKAQLRRLWERGELLRPLVTGATAFPLRLALKAPGSAELTGRFEAVRSWMAELVAIPRIRIEWREVNHRILGLQRLPQSVWIDSLDDALALAGKRGDAARFGQLLALTRAKQPALLDWLARRPLQAVELAEQWPQLLAVVDWLARHPRPGIYLRQVDVPGVHSKFIEAHRGVLGELLDLALPPEAIAAGRSSAGQFAARYGFLDKPIRIRFRVLDQRIGWPPGPAHPGAMPAERIGGPSRATHPDALPEERIGGVPRSQLPDVTLDADSFARLNLPVRRVFITENETNFLAFPPVADALVVFGAGYGWDALARAGWLARCSIHYWGDIDTHGFAILDQLRSRFAHVASFLMDRATLLAHEAQWGKEADQLLHDLPRLTGEERALFDDLRDNRIRRGLRLEQERVGFGWVTAALGPVVGGEA